MKVKDSLTCHSVQFLTSCVVFKVNVRLTQEGYFCLRLLHLDCLTNRTASSHYTNRLLHGLLCPNVRI